MKALGIIFSNLHDRQVHEMTGIRTMASVPFGGRYRLVDFVLSSMVNSGVKKVGIITKHNYQSLMDHVGSGKYWDLARKNGGLMMLPPFGDQVSSTLYTSRLQALEGAGAFIRRSSEDYVILSDCDSVCNIDYRPILAFHEEKGAEITFVYREKKVEHGSEKIVFELEPDGRIASARKNRGGGANLCVYANIAVMRRSCLISLLEDARANGYTSFSEDIMIKNRAQRRCYAYRFEGYFASIDSLANYLKHNLELLDKKNRDSLFAPGRPINTKIKDSAPTFVGDYAEISDSLIADGCRIYGTVRHSILFRGVTVAKNAVVENCVIMQDAVISRDSSLAYVIADKGVVVKDNRVLAGCAALPYYVPKAVVL